MTLLGGLRSGTGGTKTTGGPDEGDNPTGTVESVTSPLGTITVTNPNGPNVLIDVTPVADTSTLFDLILSYGHGMAVDANLPALGSFWFSPTTIADLATASQVREWVTTDALAFLALVIRVDAAHLVTGGGSFIVTVDGADTAITLALAAGDTTDTTLETSALFAVAADSRIGVRWDGSAAADGSTLRAEIRLRGAASGSPIIPDTLPVTPLALFRPGDLALDGTTWLDSVAGSVFSLSVPNFGPPPLGYLQQITGPVRTLDGSFKNNPYAKFSAYHNSTAGADYTVMMLRTTAAMFAGGATPQARTLCAVLKPSNALGGIVGCFKNNDLSFRACMLRKISSGPQWAYTNRDPGLGGTEIQVTTPVNWAAQELVCVWRSDGVTLQFFVNGVLVVTTTDTVGAETGTNAGFCMGNFVASQWISELGFQGGIVFEGVWARKFTDAEVISATSNLAGLYVT
jgi:hypothetical protein